MNLAQTIGVEDLDQETASKKDSKPSIYSQKLGKYIPFDFSNPKGEIQKYNVGLGPGSWY